jgi:o-succinylbenzoate synthase
MRIDAVTIHRVRMPLVYPFRTAFGNDDVIESVLVRMESGGKVGWGEATPWASPGYSSECAATAFHVSRQFLAPRLIGQDIDSGQRLQQALRHVKGNYFAKAALDLAWWDLHARRRDEPLWKTLGGPGPVVAVGADFGIMESIGALLDEIGQAIEAGFGRVKLKYRPGWELDMLAAVRERFPDATFHVDCNSAYTLDDAAMLRELDRFDLAMIEQPLMHDDLIDHAALQKQLRTPICLDESITSPDRARKAIQLGACGWINIKPGRVGGLTNALAILDLCRSADVPCWVGGMLESAVGARHCLALATCGNIRYPSDIFPTERFYRQDLAEPAMVLSGPGQMTASDSPGCGAEPLPDRLENMSLDTARCP